MLNINEKSTHYTKLDAGDVFTVEGSEQTYAVCQKILIEGRLGGMGEQPDRVKLVLNNGGVLHLDGWTKYDIPFTIIERKDKAWVKQVAQHYTPMIKRPA